MKPVELDRVGIAFGDAGLSVATDDMRKVSVSARMKDSNHMKLDVGRSQTQSGKVRMEQSGREARLQI